MADLKERSLGTALFVTVPEQPEIDRGFKECCFDQIVLADTSDDSKHLNDYKGFYYQKQTPMDDCKFYLVESDSTETLITDDTYGEYVPFGDVVENADLTFFVVEWRKVLSALGEGTYQIKKEITTGMITKDIYSNHFKLRAYTKELADNTWRMDVVMSGVLRDSKVNFANAGFRTTVRARGFFGNSNPEYEENNYVSREKYKQIQNDIRMEDVWVLQTDPIPDCITKEILYFMLLAPEMYMNDYNGNNHRYDLFRVPVKLGSMDNVNYWSQTRGARLNITFRDRYLNKGRSHC